MTSFSSVCLFSKFSYLLLLWNQSYLYSSFVETEGAIPADFTPTIKSVQDLFG